MRQRKYRRRTLAEALHGFGERSTAMLGQVEAVRVSADRQDQFNPRQECAQPRVPQRCAFGAWRQITALAGTGVAQSHRHDRDMALVVEALAIQFQPRAQQIARGIVPRQAGLVDAAAGRLSDDQQACGRARAQHRTRAERQMRLAQSACAGLGEGASKGASEGARSPIGRWPGAILRAPLRSALHRQPRSEYVPHAPSVPTTPPTPQRFDR